MCVCVCVRVDAFTHVLIVYMAQQNRHCITFAVSICIKVLSAQAMVQAMKSMVFMRPMKAMKVSATPDLGFVLERPSGRSVVAAADAVEDLSIEACLQLQDFRKAHRIEDKEDQLLGVAIRAPPKALVELLQNDTWEQAQLQAAVDFCKSLERQHGSHVGNLLQQHRAKKSAAERKKFALALSVVKDTSTLRCVEMESLTQSSTASRAAGWNRAFQIWKIEGIPCTRATLQLRLACLAPLRCKPHNNPARQALGEKLFWYEGQAEETLASSHSHRVDATAKSADITESDFVACQNDFRSHRKESH